MDSNGATAAQPSGNQKQPEVRLGKVSTTKETLSNERAEKSQHLRFLPPTPQQVTNYARSKNLFLDSERFCDYYTSKGWKVGRSPMRDWKAAVRNWAAREQKGAHHANDNRAARAAKYAAYG
jgi:hypothetical protein